MGMLRKFDDLNLGDAMGQGTTHEENGPKLPVCRKHAAVFTNSLPINLRADERADTGTAHWALGFLADGQCEVLGVWLASSLRQKEWQHIVEELRPRGVERIRCVVRDAQMEEADGAWTVFRGAVILPSTGQLIDLSLCEVAPRTRAAIRADLERMRAAGSAAEARAHLAAFAASSRGARYPAVVARWSAALERMGPLYAMTRRQRAIVDAGDDLVCRLHRSLARAVARHGVFSDREAAVAFMVRALARAEREFDVLGAGVRAPRKVRTERLDRWSGVAALSS